MSCLTVSTKSTNSMCPMNQTAQSNLLKFLDSSHLPCAAQFQRSVPVLDCCLPPPPPPPPKILKNIVIQKENPKERRKKKSFRNNSIPTKLHICIFGSETFHFQPVSPLALCKYRRGPCLHVCMHRDVM